MLVAQMIGRNEADKYLHQVLSRLLHFIDLIVFTDDHSDDSTPDIALSYGAKVSQSVRPTFELHEGALRQLAWDHLSKFVQEGDWVLAIDCDEL